MHSGHRHVEAQWGSQQVQVHPSSVWLHQQGPQRRGKTTEHRENLEACIHLFTVVVCAANDDPDQSERHIQRGPAHGGGWALAGLSFTGILQPGTDSCWTLSRHFKVTIWYDAVFDEISVIWRGMFWSTVTWTLNVLALRWDSGTVQLIFEGQRQTGRFFIDTVCYQVVWEFIFQMIWPCWCSSL